MNLSSLLLLAILGLVQTCRGLNILMYISAMGHSHVSFNGNIADVLIDAGHNLTILHQFLDPDVTTIATTRAARYIYYKAENVDFSGFLNMSAKTPACFSPNRQAGTDLPMLFQTRLSVCQAIVNDDNLRDTLRQTKFDLAISEYNEECQEGLFEVLGINTTIMTSAISMYYPIFFNHGIPNIPSMAPAIILPFTPQMSFKQRAINALVNYKIEELYSTTLTAMNAFYKKKFGDDFPELLQLRRQKTAYSFINAHEYFEFPTLTTTKVKFLGGLQPREAPPIPAHTLEVIDSKKGFVVLSFGTFARSHTVPEHVRQGIALAMNSFPEYAFFWKYSVSEGEDLSFLNGSTNIHLQDWIPQHALLNHPKCRAFITHCGANSVVEAVSAGVPMIAVPLFTDQLHNAAVVADRKVGILLGRENLSQVGVTFALQQLLKESESSYHVQAKLYAERIQDNLKIMSPEEAIVRFVEFAGKHGNMADMDLSSSDLPFAQLYMLDILLPVVLAAALAIALLVCLIKSIARQVFAKRSAKNKTE